jgi:hypothetical protein
MTWESFLNSKSNNLMKKISTLFIYFILFAPAFSFAQHTFTSGNTSMEIGGYIIAFYSYEPNAPGITFTGKHNLFDLDDARLQFSGFTKGGGNLGSFKWEMEANFATITEIAIDGISKIKDQPLTEANVTYMNPIVNIKVGYMKVPFSAISNEDKMGTPFLDRPQIANGDYFSRRDAGILLMKDFWHQRITLTAGAVSGMGEQIMLGKGAVNGQPSFVARAQFSNAYYRNQEEIDYRDLQKPVFRIVGDLMYDKNTIFSGEGDNLVNTSNVKTVDGLKISYGIEGALMWRGFSAQFELDNAYIKPNQAAANTLMLPQYNTQYFLDGGYAAQASYYNRTLMSVFSVRYSSFRETDLVAGNEQSTLAFAYNFIFRPYNLTFKAHYGYYFKQPDSGIKWDNDHFRVGIQWVF